MRVFFLLLLLTGLGMSFGYPLLVDELGGRDIGSYPIYDAATGFRPLELALKATDAPIGVSVQMKTIGQPALAGDGTVLTLVVDKGGRSVLAEALAFRDAAP